MEAIKDTEISTKAVLLGFLVDIGATFALGIVTAVFGLVQAFRLGISMQDLGAKLPELMMGPGWLFASLITGMSSTFLGGFVAGRIAGRAHLLHGTVMGGLSLLLAIAQMRFSSELDLPMWYMALGILLTIPVAVWGASVAARSKKDGK